MSLFDLAKLEKEINELHNQTLKEDFWIDSTNSGNILSKLKALQNKHSRYMHILTELNNVSELNDLLLSELDEEMAKDVLRASKKLEKDIDTIELETLLNGKYDRNNAIVTIHPGAGGTESQDWAEMLYRMYAKWANSNEYNLKELDYLEGDEAGLKSVTFSVEGENTYGYLKAEKGVHRLVRISPFDSGGRRHTSFASVEVMPEISEDVVIEINRRRFKNRYI